LTDFKECPIAIATSLGDFSNYSVVDVEVKPS
jgi:hypothetical protein